FASVSCWRCVRSISPSLAWDSDVRRRTSEALYRSTNFLSVQACESAASDAARQRSTNSRRCTAEVNALSRMSFNNGVEEGDADGAVTVRLDAPDRSTPPGAVMESCTFGKPLRIACIEAARSVELTVPLTATPP